MSESGKPTLDEVQAETERANNMLVFMGIVLAFVLVGYVVKTCASMPDPSLECAKVPGHEWVPERYEDNKDSSYPIKINGFCGKAP